MRDVTISIQNITAENTNIVNNTIPLKVTFEILNQADKALSTSEIEYSVNANNTHLGNGILSYENIPPNGRPQIYQNSPVTLESTFLLSRTSSNSELFDNILSDKFVANSTEWNVNGTAQIDSAFTIYPIAFSSKLRVTKLNNLIFHSSCIPFRNQQQSIPLTKHTLLDYKDFLHLQMNMNVDKHS